ncbi:MAG: hypothetical protein Q8M76_10335, partial [Spirochaetaceae bacterium]|nr:hypothetical protein [Spirochaetaceae bacterium]
MDIEGSLREAIRYETSIRDLYRDAARRTAWEGSRRFFSYMERDERSHVAFLEAKAAELRLAGRIGPDLDLAPPLERARIDEAKRAARHALSGADRGGLVESLAKALDAEEKTTAFYRGLVDAGLKGSEPAGEEAAMLFSRFLKIEEGHTLIVRAELDLASNTGFW